MPIFREYLRNAIDWQQYGFEIVCEARNGQEALELVAEYQPDIVLSDITMPFMDGLELAEKIKSNYDSEVVLITGNSEFEYARKAVKLSVADYIVKPFEKEELILTLLNLKNNIEKTIDLSLEKEDERTLKREDLLKQLIYREKLNHLSSQTLAANDIQLNEDQKYYVTVIETEANIDQLDISEQAMNWKHVIGSLYKDYVEVEGLQYLFKDHESRMIILSVLEEDFIELDTEDLNVLISLIKDRLSFDVTIGIGMVNTGYSNVRNSYLQALNALNNRFIHGRNKVLSYKAISSDQKGYGFYSAEVNEVIINNLNQMNEEGVLKILHDVFKEADALKYSFEYNRMIVMGLLSLLLSYIVKVGKNIQDIFDDFNPRDIVMNKDIEAQRTYIIKAYQSVLVYLNTHKESQSSIVARKAKKCIDEKYADFDFSMQVLTKELLVNQTYLRKMFKSEFHMTITEYLVKVRMEHAKGLIINANYKLSAVAEMVGYRDAGYFSRSFKKHFGVSPSEFQS